MERILHLVKSVVLLGATALIFSASAEVVLIAPPEKTDPGPAGTDYPPSRFGQAPTQPTVVESANARVPASLTYEDEYQRRPVRDKNLMATETTTTSRPPVENPKALSNDLVPDSKKGVQEVAIIAGDIGFFPKTFFVNRDIPVRLFVTGSSKNTLCLMMDSFQVRKQVHSQEIQEITFTPKNPGIYRFYCPINGMEGTMVVRELASQ